MMNAGANTLTAATRSGRYRAYIRLMRPANVVTALADVLAGFALAGLPALSGLGWLLLASAALYAGGVVLNDAFDAELDAAERPERPIPSGRAARESAFVLGSGLLFLGTVAAFFAGPLPGLVGLALATSALLYNAAAKHSVIAGPYVIGTCRALNLLLGLSIVPAALIERAWIAVLPLTYVAAIGLLARGEVQPGNRRERATSVALVVGVIAALAALALTQPYALPALLLTTGFAVIVLRAFWAAARTGDPLLTRQTVATALFGIVILDAVLATAAAGTAAGFAVLCLLLVAHPLSRRFAVT